MESGTLLHRLELREGELRVRIDHLQKELEDLETSIRRIQIAREEIQALGTLDSLSDAQDAVVAPTPDSAVVSPPTVHREHLPAGRRRVGPVSDKIVTILASGDRTWRADEMTDALGLPRGRGRTRVESTRQKLDRLVELGLARSIRPGLYAIAETTSEEEG